MGAPRIEIARQVSAVVFPQQRYVLMICRNFGWVTCRRGWRRKSPRGERPLQLQATRSIAILARYLSLEIIQEIMEDGNSSVK